MEWISVKDKLPPQNWRVIVKNGKSILESVYYHYKKWWHWDRRLHKVTHWKYSEHSKPPIPVKDSRAYFRRAKLYRNQMQKRHLSLPGFTHDAMD